MPIVSTPIESSERKPTEFDFERFQKTLTNNSENIVVLIEKKLDEKFQEFTSIISERVFRKQSDCLKSLLDTKFAQMIQKSDKLMQKRIEDSLLEVLPRFTDLSDGMAKLRDQVSSDMKCLSEPRHDEITDMMSKLSDISETLSAHRIFDPSGISDKMPERCISKPSNISDHVSEHRTSEECYASGSDHSSSERHVSESCRADIGSEQFASEGSPADCSKQSGPSEHGISTSRPADGSKQPGSSEGAVSGMLVSDPPLSMSPPAKALMQQVM